MSSPIIAMVATAEWSNVGDLATKVALLVMLAVTIILLIVLLKRNSAAAVRADVKSIVDDVARCADRIERTVRDETQRVRADVERNLVGMLQERLNTIDAAQGVRLSAIRDEMGRQRSELSAALERHAVTIGDRLKVDSDRHAELSESLANRLAQVETTVGNRLDAVRTTVDVKLAQIQDDSARKLDEMRATVAEKLQTTLERRVGESFALVSQQLEQVQRGLGEMQSLSENVGDLRRVMSNVRSRGTLGEWRLESVLEQLLAPDQYAKNVKPIPDSNAVVEFAIRVPQREDSGSPMWLPVDSKFPSDTYEQVLDAQDAGDKDALGLARRDLAAAVRRAAKDISSKYIEPPHTTDYAILFLPTEGLFAEVVQQPGLIEELHREHRVTIAGPTTFATLLNCLQMGFRSVAVAERSKEVWNLLGAVRGEFQKFNSAFAAVKKRLDQARSAVEGVEVRTRAMGRTLRVVDSMEHATIPRLIKSEYLTTESYCDSDLPAEVVAANASH